MCCVLDASEILTCITFGRGTKVLLTCRLIRNGDLSSQPLFARAVLKLYKKFTATARDPSRYVFIACN
jgi:hypothetical protein